LKDEFPDDESLILTGGSLPAHFSESQFIPLLNMLRGILMRRRWTTGFADGLEPVIPKLPPVIVKFRKVFSIEHWIAALSIRDPY
jgi:hypothetical protein